MGNLANGRHSRWLNGGELERCIHNEQQADVFSIAKKEMPTLKFTSEDRNRGSGTDSLVARR